MTSRTPIVSILSYAEFRARSINEVKKVQKLTNICRVVGVTRMIEPKIDQKIVKKLIMKWDPEGRSGRLVYES